MPAARQWSLLERSVPADPIRARLARLGTLPGGGVSERPKEHASKACEVKASEGSNPSATAIPTRRTPVCPGAAPAFRMVVSAVA